MADERFYKGAPMPKTLGGCVDEYHDVKEIRLAMQHEVDDVQEREKELKAHIIANLSKSDEGGAVGKRYLGKITEKDSAKISDWPAFCAHVQETGDFDLMQKRVTMEAAKDRWNANVAIPGVERVWVPDVSVTKL